MTVAHACNGAFLVLENCSDQSGVSVVMVQCAGQTCVQTQPDQGGEVDAI